MDDFPGRAGESLEIATDLGFAGELSTDFASRAIDKFLAISFAAAKSSTVNV
jgi:hypothetical protein